MPSPSPTYLACPTRPFRYASSSELTANEYVPEIDQDYLFDRETTLAILAGFRPQPPRHDPGYHGTGKSTHIEQVAARLNWPCVRVNLDSHISRIDLVGKDAIVIKDGKQVTEFREGILPWACSTMSRSCSTNTTPAART
jgi:cobaltochelatase CobS